MENKIIEAIQTLKDYCSQFNNCEEGCKLFDDFGCGLQETVPENYLTDWSEKDE